MECKRCERPIRNFGGEEILDDVNWPDRLCHGCWEVESRLGDYLRHPKCMKFIEAAIVRTNRINNQPNKSFFYRCFLILGFILGFLSAMCFFWG